MTATGTVRSGRILERTPRLCLGCQARITYGDPKPSMAWAERLRLDPISATQHDLLLVAAAEFAELGGGDPVEFLDWVSVEALGRTQDVAYFEGRTVVEPASGTFASARHSEAFPLPGRGTL